MVDKTMRALHGRWST